MKKISIFILVIALMVFPYNAVVAAIPEEPAVIQEDTTQNIVIIDAKTKERNIVTTEWVPEWGKTEPINMADGNKILAGKGPIANPSNTIINNTPIPDFDLPVSSRGAAAGQYANDVNLLGSWMTVDDPRTIQRHRSTVLLYAYKEGITTPAKGSGFMIGPSAVVTCAHCVYGSMFNTEDNLPTDLFVMPAYAENLPSNDTNPPYGHASVVAYAFFQEYLDDTDNSYYDWAILLLDSNIGDLTGYPSLQTSISTGQKFTSIGYPKCTNENFLVTICRQFRSDGNISSIHAYYFRSTNSNSAKGMSGGPVYAFNTNSIIGIIQGGVKDQYNKYLRVSTMVLDLVGMYQSRRV